MPGRGNNTLDLFLITDNRTAASSGRWLMFLDVKTYSSQFQMFWLSEIHTVRLLWVKDFKKNNTFYEQL